MKKINKWTSPETSQKTNGILWKEHVWEKVKENQPNASSSADLWSAPPFRTLNEKYINLKCNHKSFFNKNINFYWHRPTPSAYQLQIRDALQNTFLFPYFGVVKCEGGLALAGFCLNCLRQQHADIIYASSGDDGGAYLNVFDTSVAAARRRWHVRV